MKIRGRHLHTLRQPPSLQTSRPLWTWKALFQAHQEVDPSADGQRECASHCEQSYGEFQCTPACQVSLPGNTSKNVTIGTENIISWHYHHFVAGVCFFLRFRNRCLSAWSLLSRKADSTFFCKSAYFVTQVNSFSSSHFITAALLARVSA